MNMPPDPQAPENPYPAEDPPKLPVFPDDPPSPPTTLQEAGAQLIYALTIGIYKLHTLIDIEIKESQK